MNLHFLVTQTPDLTPYPPPPPPPFLAVKNVKNDRSFTRLNSYVLVCEPKTSHVTRTTHMTLKAVTCFFRLEHDTVVIVSDKFEYDVIV